MRAPMRGLGFVWPGRGEPSCRHLVCFMQGRGGAKQPSGLTADLTWLEPPRPMRLTALAQGRPARCRYASHLAAPAGPPRVVADENLAANDVAGRVVPSITSVPSSHVMPARSVTRMDVSSAAGHTMAARHKVWIVPTRQHFDPRGLSCGLGAISRDRCGPAMRKGNRAAAAAAVRLAAPSSWSDSLPAEPPLRCLVQGQRRRKRCDPGREVHRQVQLLQAPPAPPIILGVHRRHTDLDTAQDNACSRGRSIRFPSGSTSTSTNKEWRRGTHRARIDRWRPWHFVVFRHSCDATAIPLRKPAVAVGLPE
jgi:hypothetical protein